MICCLKVLSERTKVSEAVRSFAQPNSNSVDRKVWRCLRRAQPSLKNSSLRYRFFENVEVLIGLDK
jgi:hypothetical protein